VQEGKPAEGIALVRRAIALDPCAPGCTYWDLGFALYAAEQYEEAVEVLKRPELARLPGRRILAASLAQLGRAEEARLETQHFLADNPDFSVGAWAATQSFRHKDDLTHFVDGYAKAGLPR
jgi:tetratricopeptide (TPR) repeat protein